MTRRAQLYIPAGASEVSQGVGAGGLREFDCIQGGETVGTRVRDSDGKLIEEWGLANGRLHGYKRFWNSEGRLTHVSYFRDGRQHGITKQWDDTGHFLAVFRMVRGTGVFVWCDNDGSLLEEHHFLDGMRHGVERWWTEDQKTVFIERYWHRGQLHGIRSDTLRLAMLRPAQMQVSIAASQGQSVDNCPHQFCELLNWWCVMWCVVI